MYNYILKMLYKTISSQAVPCISRFGGLIASPCLQVFYIEKEHLSKNATPVLPRSPRHKIPATQVDTSPARMMGRRRPYGEVKRSDLRAAGDKEQEAGAPGRTARIKDVTRSKGSSCAAACRGLNNRLPCPSAKL